MLEDFHFIPESKSTTLIYKFGSGTAHSPYDDGLTTMGAGTAIYYFTSTGTLGTIYAFAAGDQKAFLKKYSNGTWSGWAALVTNADLPLSAKTYQLGGSQTLSFSYAGGNASCVIFAMRDSNAGIYLCDNWNNVVTAKDFANLNVSISNKTVTIQNNNANMAISIIVLIANNMPITQA